MNATGMLAATFITVTGLTERELPKEGCPSGVLHIAIKGLCVGAAQDLRHDAIGYLTLYRREKCKVTQTTAEQRNFAFYRKEVLLPFIALVRENLYGLKMGDPVPYELTAVSWSDGASVQLNAITDEQQQEMDSELKISSNKHSASRTAVEQPCDISPCFRSFRKLANGTSRDDVPAVGLQKKVKIKFAELKQKGILDLSEKKESALLDFLGSYPSIVSRACPTESIARGFLLNGMVDADSKANPDIAMILKTCKDKRKMQTHQALIEDKFGELYSESSATGMVSDRFQESLGGAVRHRLYWRFHPSIFRLRVVSAFEEPIQRSPA